MLAELFQVEVLPIGILEVLVDALDAIGGGLHTLVVAVVKDVEFFRGEQFFENVLVFLENMRDELIGFAE